MSRPVGSGLGQGSRHRDILVRLHGALMDGEEYVRLVPEDATSSDRVCLVRAAKRLEALGKIQRLKRKGSNGRHRSYVALPEANIRPQVVVVPQSERLQGTEEMDLIAVRAQVLFYDGGACQKCGATECRLIVTHMVPLALGGEHEWANLWTLCEGCHQLKEASDRRLIRAKNKTLSD